MSENNGFALNQRFLQCCKTATAVEISGLLECTAVHKIWLSHSPYILTFINADVTSFELGDETSLEGSSISAKTCVPV